MYDDWYHIVQVHGVDKRLYLDLYGIVNIFLNYFFKYFLSILFHFILFYFIYLFIFLQKWYYSKMFSYILIIPFTTNKHNGNKVLKKIKIIIKLLWQKYIHKNCKIENKFLHW